MLTRKIGDTLKYVLDAIVRGFAASGINPNFLTFIGFAINCLARICSPPGISAGRAPPSCWQVFSI